MLVCVPFLFFFFCGWLLPFVMLSQQGPFLSFCIPLSLFFLSCLSVASSLSFLYSLLRLSPFPLYLLLCFLSLSLSFVLHFSVSLSLLSSLPHVLAWQKQIVWRTRTRVTSSTSPGGDMWRSDGCWLRYGPAPYICLSAAAPRRIAPRHAASTCSRAPIRQP